MNIGPILSKEDTPFSDLERNRSSGYETEPFPDFDRYGDLAFG
jgi:hypothetical protein